MSTLTTDGTRADVQAKIDAAGDGDTVTLPAGTFVWPSTVSLSGKFIHLKGLGAGRVVARSASMAEVATGAKTFELIPENVASIAALRSSITPGTTLKIYRTGGEQNGTNWGTGKLPWLRGTVSALSGNVLTMDITLVSPDVDGTHPLWIITTEAATTVLHAGPSDSRGLIVQEHASGHVEISGIRFGYDVSGGREEVQQLLIGSVPNGKPVLVHDCYFERTYKGTLVRTRRGIFWNCSFVSPLMAFNGLAIQNVDLGDSDSWTTPSTMGTADTTGMTNLYVEDCDFHAWISATDCDSNSRAVFRNYLVNHCSLASHGADTGPFGVRHVEIYDGEFVFQPFNNGQTLPLDRQINMRGGTWVITGNIIPHLYSQDYAHKIDIAIECQNIQRNSGPNPGFGYKIPGVQYPCPRQVGRGRTNGTGVDGLGRNVDAVTFVGDSEPAYIWNNTGTPVVAVKEFGYEPGVSIGSSAEDFAANADKVADYIVRGRDFIDDGTAKPGWQRFPYPHPLRSGQPVPVPNPTPAPPPPKGTAPTVSVSPEVQIAKKKATVIFTATATGSPTPTYQWSKDGAAIPGATSATLTLRQVHRGSSGLYAATASNGVGRPATDDGTLVVR